MSRKDVRHIPTSSTHACVSVVYIYILYIIKQYRQNCFRANICMSKGAYEYTHNNRVCENVSYQWCQIELMTTTVQKKNNNKTTQRRYNMYVPKQ